MKRALKVREAVQADLGLLLPLYRQLNPSDPTLDLVGASKMAWKLHREWNIPAEALIAPPRARGRKSAA